MAKITLGSAPKTFTHVARFSMVGGGEGEVTVQYRYRTRSAFAEFIGQVYPEIKAPPTPAKRATPGIDLDAEAARQLEKDVAHIMGSVVSWDLDDEFNAANVRRLVDEFPAAASALIEGYAKAINEGRTGN